MIPSSPSWSSFEFAAAWVVALFVVQPPPASADAIDRYLARQQAIFEIPALVVGVVRDGRLVDQRARGLVNIELGVKATPAHVFEIGSISKQFTAYAVLILTEEGRLSLDAPIGTYLADLPERWKRPTLHQLLTHTAGIPDLEAAFGYGIYRETPSDADFTARLATLPIDFEPGSKWRYSNTNYWLLARAIEQVSGVSYSEFMRSRIFKPLGMKSTRTAEPRQILAGRAAGYERAADRLENRDPMQPNTGRGLGDIASTLLDLALWEREQLSPRLIAQATADLARIPVKLNDGTQSPYGYGWSTEPILPKAALHHDGQTAGFTAAYVRVPERRLAIVVLTNLYGAPTSSIARYLARQSDKVLRSPPLRAIPDDDLALTKRVGEIYINAANAPAAWRREWFAPDFWKEMEPWLSDAANLNRRRGVVRGVTLVERALDGSGRSLKYRVAYRDATRIVTVRVDSEGRVTGFSGEDE